MPTITQVATELHTTLTEAAERAAQHTGFIKRQRKLTGPLLAQTLVLGWLHQPEATLSQLTQTAAGLGVPLTPQALDQRFTPSAAEFLNEMLKQTVLTAITADPAALPVLERFTAVVAEDSTIVSLPDALSVVWQGTGERTGHNQSSLKIQVRWDLLGGGLEGLLLQDGRSNDNSSPLQSTALPAGALRLTDLGYFNLDVLAAEDKARVYWLNRLKVQTAVFDDKGQRWDVGKLLAAQKTDMIDLPVSLGVQMCLPARLLASRVSAEIAAQRRRKLHAQAKHKGQAVSKARLELADWTILVTNVPASLLSLQDALVLYKMRWQIELLFKLWKQHGKLDESRSAKPWRILCEVYAKLLALVLQHWVLLVSCWDWPERSLVKAAQVVRSNIALIIAAFRDRLPMREALELIRDSMKAGCRMNPRRKAPNAYQLLLSLQEVA